MAPSKREIVRGSLERRLANRADDGSEFARNEPATIIPHRSLRKLAKSQRAILSLSIATLLVAGAATTFGAIQYDGRGHQRLTDFDARQRMVDSGDEKAKRATMPRVVGDALSDVRLLRHIAETSQDEETKRMAASYLDQITRAASR